LIAPRADADLKAIFLRQVAERFNDDFIIMFMDKAARHTAGKLKVPENMKLLFLLHTVHSSIPWNISGKKSGKVFCQRGVREY
jgi:hypothetical protein